MQPEAQIDDDRPVREIVGDAVSRWEALTGVRMDETGYSFGTLGIGGMNRMLKEALDLDPEGTTAYLLLEVFLRFYLEDKTFTAAEIMKDYDAATGFLRDSENLFSIVQSERAAEIAAQFRARVISGLKRYGADRPDVVEMVESQDAIPFLRRDALRSLETLRAYQFLEGEADSAHPQAIRHVHMAWSVNDLLAAARDMPMSGVGLVLMRDASHPNRSYFSFVLRNGGNVILFTDRSKPVYPGQEDVLSSRGGRGLARDYAARENANHFPYQLIPTSLDDKGDVVFERETAPVAAGLNLVPLMEIGELPPAQAIWVTMMLSLIADRFWTQSWRAPELSYTGAMIQRRELLVTDEAGTQLPAAQDYRPIELEDVRLEEVTAAAMAEQTDYAPESFNSWLEERYKDRVPHEVLNTWARKHDEILFLPKTDQEDGPLKAIAKNAVALPGGIHAMKQQDFERLPFWDQPKMYQLSGFSEADFGSEDELRKDRLFIARQNMAACIQKCADDEFAERKDAVLKWYSGAIHANSKSLLALVAAGPGEPEKLPGGYRRRLMAFGEIGNEDVFDHFSVYGWGEANCLAEWDGRKWRCFLTGAKATYRAALAPRHLDDIMLLTGLPKEQIPDVLHAWGGQDRHSGNHLLRRIDPMDTDVRNPWCRKNLKLEVNIYLSKRGYSRVLNGKY